MDDRLQAMIVLQTRSISDVMEAIDKGATGTAFLVDESGCLVGVVTDGDIRRAILKGIKLDISIRTIMNIDPVFLQNEYSPVSVYHMMVKRHLLCLPVIDKNKHIKEFVYLPELATELEEKKFTSLNKQPVKHVLVIGGSGYIGSVVVRMLLAQGYRTKVFDALIHGSDSLRELEQNSNFNLIKGDTRNVEQIIDAAQDIDAVIHLGEIVGDPACQLNPDFTIDVNYSATRKVAEVCCNLGIQRFLFASSCSVYGASTEVLTENSPLKPVSLYARCKIEAERAVLSLKGNNFLPTIFRFATVFGMSYRPRFDLVVNLMAAEAVIAKKIKVIGGKQWRPFIHVNDIGKVLLQSLKMPLDVIGGEIFNLGLEKNNHRIDDIAEIVGNVVAGLTIDRPESIVDLRDYRVSFFKLQEVFNFTDGYSVEQGVKEIVNAVQNRIVSDYTDRRHSNYHNLINI